MSEMVKKIFNVIFWVIFGVLMLVWLTDFFRVRAEREPVFCIRKKTHTYEDGKVHECLGLGYKVYRYDRESLNEALEFGPFFIKIRSE